MSDFLDAFMELADVFVKARDGVKPKEESDEIRALREEYGNLLLAAQAKAEELELELALANVEANDLRKDLKKVALQRDDAQLFLRKATNTLQRCYKASTILHEALYGVGS